MAIYGLKGNSYFNVCGKWLDHMSRPVSVDLAKELDARYPREYVAKKETKPKAKVKVAPGPLSQTPYGSFYNQKPATNKNGTSFTNNTSANKQMKSGKNYQSTSSTKSIPTPKSRKKATERDTYEQVVLTREQEAALQVLESGGNAFLSGEAGTGKSFVINEYLRRNRKKKNIIVCAFTGVAAINVGGSTLHRVFEMPIGAVRTGEYNRKPSDALQKADVIIVDEISMCRFDYFEYVVRTLHQAESMAQQNIFAKALSSGDTPNWDNSKQLIVVGDFYQLPPVITQNDRELFRQYWESESIKEGFAFQSPLWNEMQFKCIVLKDIIRQKDKEFTMNLNKIRMGDSSGIDYFNQNDCKDSISNAIYLCARNAEANEINQKKAEELPGEAVAYHAQVKGTVGDGDKLTSDELILKTGMQVMTLVNNVEEGYQNGSVGKVVSLNAETVGVRLNNGKLVEVKPYDWETITYEVQEEKLEKVVLGNFKQIPLKIAYAITIHKAQGQTYSGANISPDCFAIGQLYVALSRVQTIEGMHLNHKIVRSALKTSNAVKTFYEDAQKKNTAKTVETPSKPVLENNKFKKQEVTKENETQDDMDCYFAYLSDMGKNNRC